MNYKKLFLFARCWWANRIAVGYSLIGIVVAIRSMPSLFWCGFGVIWILGSLPFARTTYRAYRYTMSYLLRDCGYQEPTDEYCVRRGSQLALKDFKRARGW